MVQSGAAEIGIGEVPTSEIGIGKSGPSEDRTCCIDVAKFRAGQLCVDEFGTCQVCLPEIRGA